LEQSYFWIRFLSTLSVLCVFGLVVLGGVVRVTGSGLGCPDWPLCYGSWIPPLEYTAIIEYSHRFVASVIVSPIVVLTCILAWLRHRGERWLVIPSSVSVVLLILQALLGGVTVLTELPGAVVASHLALGQAFLGCLVLVMVVSYRGPLGFHGKPYSWVSFPVMSIIASMGVYLLILSGSVVTATHATGACIAWPLCNSTLLPDTILSAIHMGHRLVAVIVGCFLIFVLNWGWRDGEKTKGFRILSGVAGGTFLLQVVVGAFVVWSGFQSHMLAFHLAMSALVWVFVLIVAILSLTRSQYIDGIIRS